VSAGAVAVGHDRLGDTGMGNKHAPTGAGCRDYGWTPTMSTMPTIRLPGVTTEISSPPRHGTV